MGNNRLVDLVFVVLIIAIAASSWAKHQPKEQPAPKPSTVAMASLQPRPQPRSAPPFALADLDGAVFQYPGKSGPAFIVLNAVGCAECRARVSTDHKAVALARAKKIPVWNMLVFGNAASGRAFVQQTGQDADKFLPDPGGSVAVNLYGGSDAACWILVDRNGHIAWQGPGNLQQFQVMLASLEADGAI